MNLYELNQFSMFNKTIAVIFAMKITYLSVSLLVVPIGLFNLLLNIIKMHNNCALYMILQIFYYFFFRY